MGKTADYYHSHPEAYARKKQTDKKINARPEQRAKRSELVTANRKRGDYGNGDGQDLHHGPGGKLIKMSAKKNRSKTGKGEGGREKGKKHHRKGFRIGRKKKKTKP